MMMQNEDTFLQKLTGDFTEDVPESVYREIASVLVESIGDAVFHFIDSHSPNDIKDKLEGKEKISEFAVGYILAAVLDIIPMGDSEGIVTKLAHYFRVQAFQGIDDLILREGLLPIIEKMKQRDVKVYAVIVVDDAAPTYRHIEGRVHFHKHEHGDVGFHYHRHEHEGGEERHTHEENHPMLVRSREHQERYHDL